jgi:hypothetical protein
MWKGKKSKNMEVEFVNDSLNMNRTQNIKPPASSLLPQASCLKHPASRRKPPASSLPLQASSLTPLGRRIQLAKQIPSITKNNRLTFYFFNIPQLTGL